MNNVENIQATEYDDEIYGSGIVNTLKGGGGDDKIEGSGGNDILYGQDGFDTLKGNAGNDTFVFESDSAFNDVDSIIDLNISTQSDKIDIADVLDGYYDYGTDVITAFVQITDNGTDSTLAIDQDGTANGTNFVSVATILGITGLTDEAALESSGALVTD